MDYLKLTRPLIFFDLETTGVSITGDRIVEISVVKLSPDGRKQVTTRRINPQMPIPPEASEIHGIYDRDVENEPAFELIAANLFNYFADCDLAGYNIMKFDIPVLTAEFRRCGLTFSTENRQVVDVYHIFCKKFPRTLTAAYEFFCGKTVENAHSAEADTLATVEVLEGQLKMYPDLPHDVAGLHDFCDLSDPDAIDSGNRFKWQGDRIIVNFGRNAGTPLRDIAVNNPGFLQWIVKADFPEDVKKIASDALRGIFPEPKAGKNEAE
ncbi:MAG: 3'-5' exonuclease [Victivallaceae bacterium]|nr:3'-5' exonuclease [Victivallaceae bacterium]